MNKNLRPKYVKIVNIEAQKGQAMINRKFDFDEIFRKISMRRLLYPKGIV